MIVTVCFIYILFVFIHVLTVFVAQIFVKFPRLTMPKANKCTQQSRDAGASKKRKCRSKAAIYKKERKDKNFKPYKMPKADE